MALSFPNPSRSYDGTRHGVWFWGYDNAREITFLVENRVLMNLDPGLGSDEAGVLASFDRHRNEILKIAMALYAEGRQTLYTLH
ncbi:DUF1488 domain-containing protein [Ralstonia solanacearum]|uniref:DUF1488 domain-containing protein n=2 Tax=Ralstonia solanacearum TaxID=305 RepID=A0AAW5ZIE7_RALSL|nr:DUF1488 domain-containing protein [Ralstonia solanacearum]MDB0507727.1 DUF1488 domain-containing protein [Ralstonia solanacearum]MDB0511997.1 DUF1488 domain-containing protein [Ralstonia solanacearum]MDB0529346.1 DUF1488 domain-containing protein [Ralstonia solanacearum]MDB0566515.1 DUF1488 domain-containing protein [Ralstonia solanacearum]MDB0569397.1 DUF1488 domain-containing protein [Ralstonia solanacearum]